MIWPRYSANGVETAGADTTVSAGTLITAGTSAAKGAYAQLIASTAREVNGFVVNIRPITARTAFDIAIGAAASEVIICADVAACAVAENFQTLYVPLPIKAGTRIAMRSNCSTNSGSARAIMHLLQGNGPVYGRCTTYGADAANVRGVLTTASATINTTEGAYAEIEDSTANPIRMLYVMTSGGTVAGAWAGLIDLAVGAGGSEVNVINDMYVRGTSATTLMPFWHGPFFVDIPAGTRLSSRMRASLTVVDVGVSILAFD